VDSVDILQFYETQMLLDSSVFL